MRYAILALILSGCASPLVTRVDAPPAPVIITQKCVQAADVPVLPPSNATRDGNMKQDAAAATSDARAARDVAEQAIVQLNNCVKE